MALTVLLLCAAPVGAARITAMPKSVDAALAGKLAKAQPGQNFDVVIKLKRIDTPRSGRVSKTGASGPSRIRAVRSLTSKSTTSQKRLVSSLKKGTSRGDVKSFRSFWITNAIVTRASAAQIKVLAAQPEVESVFPNYKVRAIPPFPSKRKGTAQASSSGSEWNLDKINIPEAWSDFGTTGDGAKVAVLDTGIDARHPDLAGKVGTFVKVDEFGAVTAATARDTDQHGTHVSGTVAGGDAGGTNIGVAPGATLMGAIVIPDGEGTFAQIIGGMQWAADPDGNPLTSDQADAVNMSFGVPGTVSQMFEPVENLLAAGVLPAVAVGNDGPDEFDSPGAVPTVLSVGATDNYDKIAFFSGGGEVTWYDAPHAGTFVKPDASAPGVDVVSSIPGSGYAAFSGTSMATPHVAGLAALLRSNDPSLTASEMSGIIQSSSVDLGAEGKDARYGTGRIDAHAALQLSQSFGTFSGTITAGGALATAMVQVISEPGGTVDATVAADSHGAYQVMAPPGSYKLLITKYGFDDVLSSTISLSDGEVESFSTDLVQATTRTLSGQLTSSATGTPIKGTVKMTSPVEQTKATNAIGQYSFSVPDGTYVMRASSYGYADSDLTVDVTGGNATGNFALNRVKPLLLVVDFAAGEYESYFTEALDTAGITYDVWRVAGEDESWLNLVDATALSQYKKVIWAAGDSVASGTLSLQLDEESEEETPPALASYLDAGGKLLITGQDVAFWLWVIEGGDEEDEEESERAGGSGAHSLAWDSSESTFLGDYLHSGLYEDVAKNLTITGRSGTVFSGMTMDLLSMGITEDGADNQLWPDLIRNDAYSIPELVYTREMTGSASLRTFTEGNGKVSFFGFGIEGIDNAADRSQTLVKALNWLDAPKGTLTIGSSVRTVQGSRSSVLRGKLTPAASGSKVRIERRDLEFVFDMDTFQVRTITTWNSIGTAKTAADGTWSSTVRPESKSTYRAVWDGNVTRTRTSSAKITVYVRPDIDLTRTNGGTIPVGQKAKFEGYFDPVPEEGGEAFLLRRSKGSNNWNYVTSFEVDEDGYFEASSKPQRNSYYRVAWEDDGELTDSLSKQRYVPTRHALTIRPEATLIPSGVKIWFGGKVSPAHPGSYLELQRMTSGSWRTMKTIKLENKNTWNASFLTFKKGAFDFRVVLRGDSTHETGVSNSVTVRFY